MNCRIIAIEEVNIPKCGHLASGIEETLIAGITVQHIICQNTLLLLPEIFGIRPSEFRRLTGKRLTFHCVITAAAEKVNRSNLELKGKYLEKYYDRKYFEK